MGSAIGIISTIATVASTVSSLSRRQSRGSSDNGAAEAVARREAEDKKRLEERRVRMAAQKEDALERENLQRKRHSAQSETIATSGSGLLGNANVGTKTLKNTLGE